VRVAGSGGLTTDLLGQRHSPPTTQQTRRETARAERESRMRQAKQKNESINEELIDRPYLARFTLGNMALEREILELFSGQMPRLIAQLRSAKTHAEWSLAAHTIRGSALAVGARDLANLAQIAESLDWNVDPQERDRAREEAANAVALASEHVCRYIACLFATG
jgi:HPt (histidine-containing phosphotransfer) domain-containing protein